MNLCVPNAPAVGDLAVLLAKPAGTRPVYSIQSSWSEATPILSSATNRGQSLGVVLRREWSLGSPSREGPIGKLCAALAGVGRSVSGLDAAAKRVTIVNVYPV